MEDKADIRKKVLMNFTSYGRATNEAEVKKPFDISMVINHMKD